MLTESTVKYVTDLSTQLKEAGVKLSAKAHTPLANLVVSANPCWTNVLEAKIKNAPENAPNHLLVNATKNSDYMSEHSQAVSILSDQLAGFVRGHLNVARSTVRPAVTAFAEAALTRIQTFKHIDPTEGFSISKVYIPVPLLNENLLDDLKIHKNRSIPNMREVLALAECSDENLVNRLFTGQASVDKDIREWLTTFDNSLLRRVWDMHFTKSAANEAFYFGSRFADRINGALALYLYSRHLAANIPADLNMTATVYQSKISAFEYYAGAITCASLKELEQATGIGRMVINMYRKEITLYGPVYDKFLEDGGSMEVILGLMVENISALTLTAINAVQAKALQGWNRYVNMANYQNKKNRAEMLRVIYSSEFVNQLNEMDPIEKEYHDKHPGAADVAIKRLRSYLEDLTEEQLEDVNAVAIKAIADIRFSYTNAFQILTDMESAMKSNPNLDPREAATIAAINITTDYVIGQIQRV